MRIARNGGISSTVRSGFINTSFRYNISLNNFQYEKLSEVTDETVGIEEIDDPNMCVDREDDLG